MITLDTSAVFALVDQRDPAHDRVRAALEADGGPFVVPVGALGEIACLIEKRLGQEVMSVILTDLEDGTYSLDCGADDLPRIRSLAGRYADLPLGTIDAIVIACAERNGGRVLTLDRRDFDVVAREGTIVVLP